MIAEKSTLAFQIFGLLRCEMRGQLPGALVRCALLLLAALSVSRAANSSQWSTRTIYQVLTDRFASPTSAACPFVPPFSLPLNVYCGGTWAALATRLDYIRGMGFDAIWISPIVDQVDFNQPIGAQGVMQACVARAFAAIVSADCQCQCAALIRVFKLFRFRFHGYWMRRLFELNARFGTREDLLALITAAHARGMYVMLDVVANHVGPVDQNFATIQVCVRVCVRACACVYVCHCV